MCGQDDIIEETTTTRVLHRLKELNASGTGEARRLQEGVVGIKVPRQEQRLGTRQGKKLPQVESRVHRALDVADL